MNNEQIKSITGTCAINLRESFQSPYDQYKEHIGKTFQIIGFNPKQDEEGSERYTIEFLDGIIIEALPEEIFSGIGWK